MHVYTAGEYYQATCAREYALDKLDRIKHEDIHCETFVQAMKAVASDLPLSAGGPLRTWMGRKIVEDTRKSEPRRFLDVVTQIPDHGLPLAKGLGNELRETTRRIRVVDDELAALKEVQCIRCEEAFRYRDFDDNWESTSLRDLHCMGCGEKDVLMST